MREGDGRPAPQEPPGKAELPGSHSDSKGTSSASWMSLGMTQGLFTSNPKREVLGSFLFHRAGTVAQRVQSFARGGAARGQTGTYTWVCAAANIAGLTSIWMGRPFGLACGEDY